MDCGIIRTRNRSNERTMPLADSLRELQELGCPVDLSVAMVEPRSCKLEIQQGEPQDSKIFDLEDGRVKSIGSLETTDGFLKLMM